MPRLSHADVKFVLTAVTSLLGPIISAPALQNSTGKSHSVSIGEHGRSSSVSAADKATLKVSHELHQAAAFIGMYTIFL